MHAFPVLSAVMTPAAMITACSLLLLGIYDKYSKIVASLRSIRAERRGLTRRQGERTDLEDDSRLRQIDTECLLLRRRLGCALRQMQTLVAATGLFLVASVLIAIEVALHIRADNAITAAVCIAFVLLVIAMVEAIREAPMIWRIVDAESPQAPPAVGRRPSQRSTSRLAR